MKTKHSLLTTGEIGPMLIRLAIPMVLGILAIHSFNFVDTYFVAQIGSTELAAISFTFPVVHFISNLTLGFAIGITSVVSRAIGKRDFEQAKRLTSNGLVLALFFTSIAMVLGLLFVKPLFSLLGAKGAVLDLTVSYMKIWFWGVPFLVMPMVGNGAIRGAGNTRNPALIMIFVSLVNVILDPVFIWGIGPIKGMGFIGAAWATVLVRSITLFLAFYILKFKEDLLMPIDFRLRAFKVTTYSIMKVALPVSFSNILHPISLGLATSMLAVYSTDIVAGFGVSSRIEAIFMIPVFAIAAACAPIAGQNFGAGLTERITILARKAWIYSSFWLVFAVIFLIFYVDSVTSLFSTKLEIIQAVRNYLFIVSWSLFFFSRMRSVNSCFNGAGKSNYSLIVVISKIFVFVIIGYLFGDFMGVNSVYWGLAISSFIGSVVSSLLLKKLF